MAGSMVRRKDRTIHHFFRTNRGPRLSTQSCGEDVRDLIGQDAKRKRNQSKFPTNCWLRAR